MQCRFLIDFNKQTLGLNEESVTEFVNILKMWDYRIENFKCHELYRL